MGKRKKLLAAASRGDEEALVALIDDSAPEVYRYLLGMLGDERDAEAAMEETFVRIARALSGDDPAPRKARGWILNCARSVAADVRPTPSAPPGPPPPDPGARAEWLGRALRSLPIQDRELLVLHDALGWDRQSLCELLEIGEDELPARLAAARSELAGRAMTEAQLEQAQPGADRVYGGS